MGSCFSKCCANTSNPPQDKLVISQSHAANPPSHDPTISQPPSSSSASTSNSSNTSSFFNSSSSSSKEPSFSDEFLLSCARKNPHIVILDPHNRSSIKRSPSTPRPKQTGQSLAIKRARSGSPPPIARQKSFKRSMAEGPTSNPTRASNNTKAIPLVERKEKLRGLDHCNPSNMRSSGSEASVSVHQIHWVHPQEVQSGRREMLSNQGGGTTIVEDIDNPLISMDCFIFL